MNVLEIQRNIYDGSMESKSLEESFYEEDACGTSKIVVEVRREIVCSSTKKKSFDRSDSWKTELYKDMVCTKLFDAKSRRPSSYRSRDDEGMSEMFYNISRSSSKEEKKASKSLIPTLSLSSFGSYDDSDSIDPDWIDLYPCPLEYREEENPELPATKRKSKFTKNSEEICKIFHITSSAVFDGGMYPPLHLWLYPYLTTAVQR